ncbi:hypothetical protein ACLOJK_028391, partial [Asimina triloba]
LTVLNRSSLVEARVQSGKNVKGTFAKQNKLQGPSTAAAFRVYPGFFQLSPSLSSSLSTFSNPGFHNSLPSTPLPMEKKKQKNAATATISISISISFQTNPPTSNSPLDTPQLNALFSSFLRLRPQRLHLRSSLQFPLLLDPLQEEDCIRTTDEPSLDVPFWIPGRVFGDDPSWFSSIFPLEGAVSLDPVDELGLIASERSKYNELRKRQLKVETESWENAVEEYRNLMEEMCQNKLAPNLPFFKSLIIGWFEPFRDAIAAEQKLQERKRQKAGYAPYIGLLPADKMAVIVMHKMLGLLMSGQDDGCVRVVLAAMYIGEAIEQEIR